MLNNSLINGSNIKYIPTQLIINEDNIVVTLPNNIDERIFYIGKEFIFNTYLGNIYEVLTNIVSINGDVILTFSNDNSFIVNPASNVPTDSIYYIYPYNKMVSGTYIKNTYIDDVYMYGQYISNNMLHFSLKINTINPKFTKVYKYHIRYYTETGDENIYTDTLNISIPLLNINDLLKFKVACYYRNTEQNDVTDFSDVQIFNIQYIEYEI